MCFPLTPHPSHLTLHPSHLTPHTSHLTPHTSHLTPTLPQDVEVLPSAPDASVGAGALDSSWAPTQPDAVVVVFASEDVAGQSAVLRGAPCLCCNIVNCRGFFPAQI